MKLHAPISRINLKVAALSAVLLIASSLPAHAVIFGTDDRRDAIQEVSARETHRSVAIAVLTGVQTWRTDVTGGRVFDLDTNPLPVCKDEKFAGDKSLDYSCTGFLVAPDLIATAGHCQVNVGVSQNETESYCRVYDWLFDYENEEGGSAQTESLAPERLYHCQRIIYAVNDEHAPYNDYALVQLDRPVIGRKPLALAAREAQVGDSVSILGFPLGTPLKYADNARIRANDPASPAYRTDLDAMDGDSGAPVMNERNEVIGILISGEPAELFYKDPVLGCNRYNTCDQDGANCKEPAVIKSSIPVFQKPGSDVFRIGLLKDLVERTLRAREN